MKNPRLRSKLVDAAIKKAYAHCAQAHYERAISSIGLIDAETPGLESDRRLKIVERYLETAGADATRWYFRG